MLTNKKAIDLFNFINSENFNSFKFTLSGNRKIQKNLKTLTSLFKDLQDLEKKHREPSDSYIKVENYKIEMIKPFAELDASGNPIVDEKGVLKLKEGNDETVRGLLSAHFQKNKEVYEEYQSKIVEWTKFFTEEDADFDFIPLESSELIIFDDSSFSFEEFDLLSILVPSLSEDPVKEESSEKE